MKADCVCPGTFDKRITVHALKSGLTPNAGGHVDETSDSNWKQVGKEWAECKSRGTREVVIDDQVRGFASQEWRIRYSKSADAYRTGMQLRMNNRRFNISEPPYNADEKNNWIVINTIEVPTT